MSIRLNQNYIDRIQVPLIPIRVLSTSTISPHTLPNFLSPFQPCYKFNPFPMSLIKKPF
jgi:hypothetical protein